MIFWFSVAQICLALVATLLCLTAAILRKNPNDLTLGSVLICGIGLLAQVVVAIIAPFVGNMPQGDPLEFWMYLVVALLLPFGGIFWALVDRRPVSHAVLALLCFAIAVMVYRMMVIWGTPGLLPVLGS